jgi:hypothetical protein
MTEKFENRLTTPAQGPDPSNTDVEDLTGPLDGDDNVYTLVFQDQGDIRETSPAGNDEQPDA